MGSALQDIKKVELRIEKQLDNTKEQLSKLAVGLRIDREKLYKRRQELVSGKALPTSEELQDLDEHDAASAQHGAGSGSSIKGVPYFWLTVLCNQDTIAEAISHRDKQALSYCTSIRATYPSKGGPPTLEMSFSANPFFSNSVLRRCLGDAEAGVQEVTTDIDWKDTAHKLTVKEVTKKAGGKKGKGKGRSKGSSGSAADEPAAKAKYKACSSFFSFFLPDLNSSKELHPAVMQFQPDPEDDDEEEEDTGKSAKQERDELLAALLLEEVLPKAVSLYTAGPLQAPSDEDDEDSDFQVVHGPVGDSAADLPPAAQRVLAALQHHQAQLDALEQQWRQQCSKLKAEQSKARLQLSQERMALLLPQGDSQASLPRFWLRVLRSADAAALAISPRDAAVLSYLADVRFSMDAGADVAERSGKWELEFLPNPYLVGPQGSSSSRVVLAKSYTFQVSAGSYRLLHSKVVAAPKWSSADKDPTHKTGKDGKQRPASSIFQLFKAGGGGGKYAFNLTGSGKDVQEEANELETELLQEIFSHLQLKAGQVYEELQQEGWHDDDTAAVDQQAWEAAAAEEEEDSDAELDEDDEGEAAHQAAVRFSKQRRSWKPTKSEWLIILVAMMLLGELFVFLDMTGVFGRGR